MEGNEKKRSSSDLLEDLTWARALALQLVGEAFADDILQETRIAAWHSKRNVQDPPVATSRSWLRVVLKRFALQKIRSEGARKRREQQVSRSESLPSAAELSSRLEQQQLLARLVAELHEPYRSTLLLRYSEGLEPKEIAERLAIPASTVRWRIKNALDSLRERLDREHRDERDAWMAALVPLLTAPSKPLPAGTALAVGVLTMKKLMAAVLVAGLVSFGLLQLGAIDSNQQEVAESSIAKVELAEVTHEAPEETLTVSSPDASRVDSASSRQPVTTEVDSGWWLTGQVTGIPDGESDRTKLRIIGEGTSESHEIHAGIAANGSVLVNLAEIFEAPELLPTELRVVITHPSLWPAEQSWNVDRDQRQAGFIDGARAVFELQRKLSPPLGTIRGEVAVPDGYRVSDLEFSLAVVEEGVPSACAVTRSGCDQNGQFALAYAEPGLYHVLVTHAEQLLPPEFVEIAVNGGEFQLAELISMSEGAVFEGVVTLNGTTPPYELTLSISKTPGSYRVCREAVVPAWREGRYHYDLRDYTTHDFGSFRITGMSPGSYRLGLAAVQVEGQLFRMFSGIENVGRITVEFPGDSARVNFDSLIHLFACVSSGIPLSQVKVQTHYDTGAASTLTGASGCIALRLAKEGRAAEISFQLEGYESVRWPITREPRGTTWETIEMPSARVREATLTLKLRGDLQRSLERFTVSLQSRDQVEHDVPFGGTWRRTSWKRSEDPIRIAGIQPGSYQLLIESDDPSNTAHQLSPDTTSMIMNTVQDVHFVAGEVRELTIDLRLGGRLRLTAICPNGCQDKSGSVAAEVRDSLGGIVESHWVTASGPGVKGSTTGHLMQRADAYLEPPLEPGSYSLRIWPGDSEGEALNFPFRINQGEVTRLQVSDPR